MKVAIAGTGYVGLVTGVTLAHIGHEVTCIDVNEEKIAMMQKGISPIYEQDLEKLMKENTKRLNYTTDYKNAYSTADVIIIGVGTPEKADGSANLQYVYNVCDNIISSIKKDCIVVIKSTVPIGTNDEIEKYLNQNIQGNIKISVVSNPEFLAQGTAVKDTLYASRIVVGTENEEARKIMAKLYEPLTKEPYNVPYLSTNRRSAEMIKYASNDFLALKISYVNEIANLCEKLDANIEDVTKGMGMDSRIGNKFLKAGIGYGGSCFPKDTKALHWLSKKMNSELLTINSTIEVNKNQKVRLYNKLIADFDGKIDNLNIAILGATFKPGTDDMREAPSIDNINLLLNHNVKITVYDPVGLSNLTKKFGNKIKYSANLEETLVNKDIAFIMTEWPEIKELTKEKYQKLMNKVNVYDGRNCYLLEEMQDEKVYYNSIGRKTIGKIIK